MSEFKIVLAAFLLAVPGALQAQEKIPPAAVKAEVGFGVRAEFWPAVAAPGEEVTLRVVVTPALGRYVYAMTQPPGDEMGLPLSPDVAPAPLVPAGPWRESPSKLKTDEVLEASYAVHEHTALLRRAFAIPPGQPAGTLLVKGHLRGMSCNDKSCLPGASLEFQARLQVDPKLAGPPLKVDPGVGWAHAARLQRAEIPAGSSSYLSVWVQPAQGRYIYAMHNLNEDILATAIALELPAGFSIGKGFFEPRPHKKNAEFIGEYFVHQHRVRFFALLSVAPAVKAGVYRIPATVEAMACDAQSCLPAEKKSFQIEVRVTARH